MARSEHTSLVRSPARPVWSLCDCASLANKRNCSVKFGKCRIISVHRLKAHGEVLDPFSLFLKRFARYEKYTDIKLEVCNEGL